MPDLEITVTTQGGCPVVQVTGELDLRTAEKLDSAIERARVPGSALVLDMTGVGFMDSHGLRSLLLANADAGPWSAPLRIVPSAIVDHTIRLAAADRVLSLYPDRDQALAGPPDRPVPAAGPAGAES